VRPSAAGEFRSPPLEPGDYTIYCRHDYARAAKLQFTIPEDSDGREFPLDIELAPAPQVTGIAVDAAGRPLARKWIDARGIDDPNVSRRDRTDERGRFEITGFYPGRYRLQIRKRPESRVALAPFAPGERRRYDLQLTR